MPFSAKAREGRITVDDLQGGTFTIQVENLKSGRDCFNSFLLVFPNGQYYRHDKDFPTMWENSYYIGGSDDGVLATPAGPVGAALCWGNGDGTFQAARTMPAGKGPTLEVPCCRESCISYNPTASEAA